MEVLEGTFVVSVITAPVLLFIISTLPCSTTKSGHGSEALRDTSAESEGAGKGSTFFVELPMK